MPKNQNEENKAQQTPAEYTPAADATVSEDATTTPITSARQRRLGTGAIVGISAAGLALIAGAFGAGAAVANVAAHNDRPSLSQTGDMAQGGKGNHEEAGGQMGQQGQMPADGAQKQGKRGPQGQHGPMSTDGTAPAPAPSASSSTTN